MANMTPQDPNVLYTPPSPPQPTPPPSEEERAGYRQLIAVLAVIIVAMFMVLIFYLYTRTPTTTSSVVRETTIQTVPAIGTQPPVTRETTTIREQTATEIPMRPAP